jgi:hypothetical protein
MSQGFLGINKMKQNTGKTKNQPGFLSQGGLGIGLGIGVAIGALLHNIGVGMAIGAGIGTVLSLLGALYNQQQKGP